MPMNLVRYVVHKSTASYLVSASFFLENGLMATGVVAVVAVVIPSSVAGASNFNSDAT